MRRVFPHRVGLILLIVLARPAIAATSTPQATASQTPAIEMPHSDIETRRSPADHWNLEVSEYRRYQTLMDGPLGKWNPTIDPLLALGMFAQSPDEERRYAELYAQQEFELTERVLRFQRAYGAAFTRLYPDAELLDHQLLAPYRNHQHQKKALREAQRRAQRELVEGDRLLAFVDRDCPDCRQTLSRLLSAVAEVPDSGLDLFIRGAHDNTAVRRWATRHKIPPRWLAQDGLTLNQDKGLYKRLQPPASGKANPSALSLFLYRQGEFFRLDSTVFTL